MPNVPTNLTREQRVNAREWLIECHPDHRRDINGLSDYRLALMIDQKWDGGWSDFVHCCTQV